MKETQMHRFKVMVPEQIVSVFTLCTHNLMGGRRRGETMREHVNKADEEMYPHTGTISQYISKAESLQTDQTHTQNMTF